MRVNAPLTLLLLALAALAFWSGGAHADVTSVTAIPTSPIFGDSVKVQADGVFYDMCSWLTGEACAVDGDTLRLTVSVFYKEAFCFQVLWYYSQICNFGVLSPGTYQVLFREVVTVYGQADPVVTVRTFPLTVTSSTPARAQTWGRLKALYR